MCREEWNFFLRLCKLAYRGYRKSSGELWQRGFSLIHVPWSLLKGTVCYARYWLLLAGLDSKNESLCQKFKKSLPNSQKIKNFQNFSITQVWLILWSVKRHWTKQSTNLWSYWLFHAVLCSQLRYACKFVESGKNPLNLSSLRILETGNFPFEAPLNSIPI